MRGEWHRLLHGKLLSDHLEPLSQMCLHTVSAPRNTLRGRCRKMLQHCTAQFGMLMCDCEMTREGYRERLQQTPCCIHTCLFATNCTVGFNALTCLQNTLIFREPQVLKTRTTWPEILNYRMFGYYILCNFGTSLVLQF